MSNEGRVTVNVYAKKGNFRYQNQPTNFRFDITNGKGPVPGAFLATQAGVNISFANLTQPGVCVLRNIGDTYPAEWGIWDGVSLFTPVGEILPGESWPIRLSRNLGSEFGTSTAVGGTGNVLRIRGWGGSTNVSIEGIDA